MQYLNKRFSVGMFANSTQPKCGCGKEVRVCTNEGSFCEECFVHYQKRKREEKKVELEKLSSQETDS